MRWPSVAASTTAGGGARPASGVATRLRRAAARRGASAIASAVASPTVAPGGVDGEREASGEAAGCGDGVVGGVASRVVATRASVAGAGPEAGRGTTTSSASEAASAAPPPHHAQRREWVPVRALASLVELMQTVRPLLPEVKQPTFLSYGLRDHTVPPSCLDAFVAELGTPKEQITQLVLPESFHILPLDVEREQLFAALGEHLRRHLPNP